MTAGAAAPHSAIGYRPDIDGLRAIAVLAVVLFHAGIAGIPGGFVGVDVFFVISGYLIGGQIHREVLAGTFSFATFYVRRVRRILPALFALLLILYAVGAVLMTPQELKELGKEAFATVFGASNLLFYTGGGYFEPAAEHNPLLMTWSLGIEEQFYVLFPFVMLAVLRAGRGAGLWAVLALTGLSFVGSLVLMEIDPKAAFYLLPTRAWELGIGAALAIGEQRPAHRRWFGRWREAAAVAAAAGLAIAIVAYRPSYPFPGIYVVLPVLATTMLIATRGSSINRIILSPTPMRFVGMISYSLYLWHWPLFYLNRVLAEPGRGLPPAVLLIASLSFAVLSWRFVEQPFRRRVLPQKVVLARYAVVAGVMAAVGLGLFVADGLPQRLTPATRMLADDAAKARRSACLAPYGATAPQALPACVPALAAGQAGRLMLLGDSHASAIASGMAQIAARAGLGFGEATKSSCLPLWRHAREMPDRAGHRAECIAFQDEAFALAMRPEVRTVALAGYWSNGMTVWNGAGGEVALADALRATIVRLERAGKTVILVQDVPMFRFDPYTRVIGEEMAVRALASALLRPRGAAERIAPPAQIEPDRARPMIAALAAEHAGRRLIDPVSALCGAEGCRYGAAGTLYYFDVQHVTAAGAVAAVRSFDARRILPAR